MIKEDKRKAEKKPKGVITKKYHVIYSACVVTEMISCK